VRRVSCVLLTSVSLVALAAGQDAPVAGTPAELLERLRAAGVEIPEGFVANEDGSVRVPAPPDAEDAAVLGGPDVHARNGIDLDVLERMLGTVFKNIGLPVFL